MCSRVEKEDNIQCAGTTGLIYLQLQTGAESGNEC